jgi:hypothetical protein
MLEEEEEYIFEHVRQGVIDTLRRRLQARISALDGDGLDHIWLEVRRQVAAAAVEGNTTAAVDLHELFVELLATKEHARKL